MNFHNIFTNKDMTGNKIYSRFAKNKIKEIDKTCKLNDTGKYKKMLKCLK